MAVESHILPVLTEHTEDEAFSIRLWLILPTRMPKVVSLIWPPYTCIPDVQSRVLVHTLKGADRFIITRVCHGKKNARRSLHHPLWDGSWHGDGGVVRSHRARRIVMSEVAVTLGDTFLL